MDLEDTENLTNVFWIFTTHEEIQRYLHASVLN